MSKLAINVVEEFETEQCYKCGVIFGLPLSISVRAKQNGQEFWCPNGHNQAYRKPENQRLREKLDEQTRVASEQAARAARAEAEAAKVNKTLTHLKKRIRMPKRQATTALGMGRIRPIATLGCSHRRQQRRRGNAAGTEGTQIERPPNARLAPGQPHPFNPLREQHTQWGLAGAEYPPGASALSV